MFNPSPENSTDDTIKSADMPVQARSKYEQVQYEIYKSNESASQANAAWRDYYAGLDNASKLEIWQEYNTRQQTPKLLDEVPGELPRNTLPVTEPSKTAASMQPADQLLDIPKRSKTNSFFSKKGQLRSLAVGIASGAVVILIFLFTLFNEIIITPFIQPGRTDGRNSVALDQAGLPLDPSPKIRIPKINVEIPIDYGLTTTDEKQVELALDNGVVHYPTSVRPGQIGNTAVFGHSSNNIFNPGKYKFAFVLLHKLEPKDLFYLTHDSKLYTYEVISSKVVKPSEVGVLGATAGQAATATLITCNPPGTSINRLVVVGKQISPDVSSNTAPTIKATGITESLTTSGLPGNGPTLARRLWDALF